MTDTSSSKSYKTLLTVRDKRLNVSAISQYHLSICVSDVHLKISCINPVTTQCLLLEVHSLAHSYAHQRLQAIEQLYQNHPLLVAKNWSKVTLCIGNQQYTLIPALFQERKIASYLDFTCTRDANTVKHCTHPSLNVAVAFAVDPLLLNWFQTTYKDTQLYIIHQASCLIEGALTFLKNKKPSLLPKVLVFAEERYLHITVIQKSTLLYYNRFSYTSSDEFLQYILIVIHTLGLDASFHEVILGGYITKNSLAYRKACNYIRKLSLSGRPPYLNFKRIFNKEMVMNHLDVLSIHLCHQAL